MSECSKRQTSIQIQISIGNMGTPESPNPGLEKQNILGTELLGEFKYQLKVKYSNIILLIFLDVIMIRLGREEVLILKR